MTIGPDSAPAAQASNVSTDRYVRCCIGAGVRPPSVGRTRPRASAGRPYVQTSDLQSFLTATTANRRRVDESLPAGPCGIMKPAQSRLGVDDSTRERCGTAESAVGYPESLW